MCIRDSCRSALDGVETLLQALLEISKMETGLIQINKKKLPLMDTVISAVNRTYPKEMCIRDRCNSKYVS